LKAHKNTPHLKSFWPQAQKNGKLLMNLQNEAIPKLYDFGQTDEYCYSIFEFVEGQSLKEIISKGPIPLESVFDMGIKILKAIDALHQKNVPHHNIKAQVVKIDRRFFDGISQDPVLQRFVKRTLQVLKSVNTEIIAEGIEKQEDLEFLRSIGVDKGQGFIWGKPAQLKKIDKAA
jgi:serine/threonine protein kinase